MRAELVFAPEAEQDIFEAYSWYENCRLGLGEEFLSCIDASIQRIRRFPDSPPMVHEDYRRVLGQAFSLRDILRVCR